MFEIEVKVRISEISKITRILESLGAEKVHVTHQKDAYLKSPIIDYKKSGEVLRIREENPGKNYVTYKGPALGSEIKTREELEVGISDGAIAIQIFKKLGFKIYATVEKKRSVYEIDKFSISIDGVQDLGTFLEIEIKTSEEKRKEAEKKIFDLLDKLLIPRKEIETRTYLEMIVENKTTS